VNDKKDEERLCSRPLIDNLKQDKYLYEILIFTGPWHQASCDSKVQFVLTGDEDATWIRTLDPCWKDTLRKGCVDSYVMKTPKYAKLVYKFVWFA
jgi:hypothetical protein